MSAVRRNAFLLPSIFTTANLFCGFLAIILASDRGDLTPRRLRWCALAILVAAILDALDGAVARGLKATSRLGMEYDSLCDLVSFGLAPAILVYGWALHDFGRMGVLASFLYLGCATLRLARFNVQVDSIEKKKFQGLPSPMAALVISSGVLIWNGSLVTRASWITSGDMQYYILALTALVAGLMVSSIPYRALKALRLHARWPFHVMVYIVVALIVWASKPGWILFAVAGLYMLSGPAEQLFRRGQSERRGRARENKKREDDSAAAPLLRPLDRANSN